MTEAKLGWASMRRVAMGFWVAFTVVAAMQAWTYWEASGREDFDRRQDRSQDEVTELRAVWTDVLAASSAARGYAHTGEAEALASYKRAAADVESRMKRLGELAADERSDGALQGRRSSTMRASGKDATAELVGLVRVAMAQMAEAVRAREAGDAPREAAGVADPSWREGGVLKQTRELVGELERDEEQSIARYADAEQRSVRRNGAVFALVTIVDVLLGALAFWVVGRFVEQRQRAEAALERARDDAEAEREAAEAARAEAVTANVAKDRVLAAVSHDLRTPLSGILLWAQLLKGRQDGDGEVSEAAEAIAKAARDQARLIDDLLDAARVANGTLQLDTAAAVDVGAVVRGACDVVAPAAAARDVTLVVGDGVTEGAVTVRGDGFRLRQVLWNLLSNAVKFTPSGGRVVGGVGVEDSAVRVSVRDSGAGIVPEFLPHVFEPFRQGERAAGGRPHGLGLGLAIVKHVVELHGGRVEAHRAGAGRGATFAVVLPVAERHEVKRENPGIRIPGLGVS